MSWAIRLTTQRTAHLQVLSEGVLQCPGLRDEEAITQARSKSDPAKEDAGDEGMVASGHAVWKQAELVSQSVLKPVAQWESVLALQQPRRWEVIVKLPGVVELNGLSKRMGYASTSKLSTPMNGSNMLKPYSAGLAVGRG